ncbi:MAG: type II secretion system F family protein, partial [Candidatus Eremiobacterota bacterium]
MTQKPAPAPLKPPASGALAVYFRSLAALFEAGVPLNRALQLLGRQGEDRRMAAIAARMAEQIDGGVMLSAAMAQQRLAFSLLHTRMVQIGERTGSLGLILGRMADYEEKRQRTTLKVRSALTYPAFLAVLATAMLVFVPPFLFQGLFTMLETSGVDLPLITRVVLGCSRFVRTPVFWVLLASVVAGAIYLLPRMLQVDRVRRRLADLLLSLPAVQRAVRLVAVTRFSRAMALQLHVGENMLGAMALSSEASANPVLVEASRRSTAALKDGATLVQALEVSHFFPRAYLHVLKAGEEAGRLPFMMTKITDMYEAELDQALDMYTALLEPLVMLVMGIIVGGVVVATMLPMMQLL